MPTATNYATAQRSLAAKDMTLIVCGGGLAGPDMARRRIRDGKQSVMTSPVRNYGERTTRRLPTYGL